MCAAMDRTVVASRLPLVERTFGDDVVTYAPGDAADLATALEGIVDDPAAREARVTRAHARVDGLSWERERRAYLDLVERTVRR